ncbi:MULTISPECIES: glycosyltransferase family 2 protein [Paracoccaceae]|uniref:glycosyltransferase family 2 protein n=1 Tax=Paracoccaceae TaxID=31989 RepID=UPI00069405B5|nr:glycosyltransferase family A protein [Pseudooceanicola atlanticus]
MTAKTFLTRVARRLIKSGPPGYVDHMDAARIAGWAYDPSDPGSPALLSVHVDGRPEMNIIADLAREDVQSAGLGPLRCGFDATLPRKLRDGKAHEVVVRLGIDGPELRGGRLKIEATGSPEESASAPADPDELRDEAAAEAIQVSTVPQAAAREEPFTSEGVAFFDPLTASVSGWANGCSQVTVRFDDGTRETVVLDREVPGFGTGSRQGFRLNVPDILRDGTTHEAVVQFDQGGRRLDGCPVSFALAPERLFVEIEDLNAGRLTLDLRDSEARRVEAQVVLRADGTDLPSESAGGRVMADLPPGARALTVEAAGTGELLARFAITGEKIEAELIRDLPASALAEEACATARAAFDTFCAEPDDRFDPLWYRWAVPAARGLDAPEDLIAHYRDTGAAEGYSPGPFFDEAAARAHYPAAADAVAEGRLPCLFALELARGHGALETLAGLSHELRRVLARKYNAGDQAGVLHNAVRDDRMMVEDAPEPDMPIPARLGAPVATMAPPESIYAAWLSRLDMSENTQLEIDRDDLAMRRDIASVALTRKPLVTIIMPTWNRAFTIGEAIQSVIEQSYDNWELIICDDASEDRTADVVRDFADPRIRYMKFLKSNGAGARSKGLAHARGEYIAYLDSDNIWHPLFLDMMLRRLLATPGTEIAYAAYLDTEIQGAKVTLQEISRPTFRPIRLSSRNFMDLNSILHHRRLYDWIGGFDTSLPRLQDWDLALRYTAVFRPIFVNHVGVFYRRNVAWGQVTHLFMNSTARDTVGEKTQRRLEHGPQPLDIPWPDRGRVTVLCGGALGHRPTVTDSSLAESLAHLAAAHAGVDLVELGSDDQSAARADDPAGLVRHTVPLALQRDPLRLSQVLASLLRGRPILAVGPTGSYLRRLEGVDHDRIWRLRPAGDGTALIGLENPTIRFDLGALPLALPAGDHAPAEMTVLGLLPTRMPGKERKALRDKLATEAQRRSLTLLVPPGEGHSRWMRHDRSGWKAATTDPATGLPDLLGQVAMTICLTPVSELDPIGLSLLTALQGQGVPATVLQDAGRARATGFARQWIEARAAYEIQVNDPKWICDKVRKLLSDEAGLERLKERSRIVHSIAFHPGQARERLGYALYRMCHDQPRKEIIDGRV